MIRTETIIRNLAQLEHEHLELLACKDKSRTQINRMDTVRKRTRRLKALLGVRTWFSRNGVNLAPSQ